MSIRKVKTPAKIFTSDIKKLESIIVKTIDKIDSIVGSSLGPGGRNIIIESELAGLPNKNTKDGVTIFKALGSADAYEHLIIEQTRDVAIRTVNEAGDGPQDLDSPILTPYGWIKMGDAKVGMDICGTNGTIQKILGVYPKGKREIYRVHFSGKSAVRCCQEHLWTVTTNYGKECTKPLKEIINDYTSKDSKRRLRHRYFVQASPVEFNEILAEMPIDPYTLGVLFGDGSLVGTDRSTIEISLGKNKEHILDKLVLPKGIMMRTTWINDKNYYRVKITGTDTNGNTIKRHLESIGLLGVGSKEKFIPQSYLYSSIVSRKALLQGLLDTDGHINNRGLFEFSTTSTKLAEDFTSLCKSLGKQITINKKNRDLCKGYSATPIFVIYERKGYKFGNKIIKIENTGEIKETQCIKVSNPDNLYITDNFIPTHNTTTATIMAAALIKNLFAFCNNNRKYSPQKTTRLIDQITSKKLLPALTKASIKITEKNKNLLEKVATISANGDKEMAKAVIEAFETVGFGSASHVTIQELSGPSGYAVELVEGFPIDKGYEESIGKFHPAFINDQAHQRCMLEKPLFILFDGKITDVVQIQEVLNKIGQEYVNGNSDFANVVIVAHKFSDQVLTNLAFNFSNPNTINVVPLATPINQLINCQLHFLMDLSAFTGAKIFDMNNPLSEGQPDEFGRNMEKIEIYRFRTTVVGDPDPTNIEVRAAEVQTLLEQSESKIEKVILEERLGKLTSGIAKLKVFGSSNGELKEKADRAEDAICSVRASITHGCLPGGGRALVNLALDLQEDKNPIIQSIIIPSLFVPFYRLLDNAGYNNKEIEEILTKMIENREHTYDVENAEFGDPKKLGILDATLAVTQALKNAVSISSVMGTLGGIVAYPRDNQLEYQNFKDQKNFERTIENAQTLSEDVNERF